MRTSIHTIKLVTLLSVMIALLAYIISSEENYVSIDLTDYLKLATINFQMD